MKELFKISLQYLRKNKLRTIFSLLGAILSVVLISTLILLNASYRDYSLRANDYFYGDYLIRYQGDQKDTVLNIIKPEYIDQKAIVHDVGFAQRTDGSFITIGGIDSISSLHYLRMWDGTYPTKENELVVSRNYAKEMKKDIGDSIALNIGDRIVDGVKLDSSTRDFVEGETFTPVSTKTFQIVGIYSPATFSQSSAVIDDMMTFAPTSMPINETGYLSLNDLGKDTWEQLERAMIAANVDNFINEYNASTLTDNPVQDAIGNTPSFAIILFILILTVLSMIKNVFNISMQEKIRYIGILQCVGATQKQLRLMACMEALVLSAIAIPIGFIASIFSTKFLLSLGEATNTLTDQVPIHYEISVSFILCIVIALFVLLIMLVSSLMPTIHIQHDQPIELIKGNRKTKKVKYHKHARTQKIFGVEALVGKRYEDRNKKGAHSILFSIGITIILFTCSTYISNSMVEPLEDLDFLQITLKPTSTIEQSEKKDEIAQQIMDLNPHKQNVYTQEMTLSNVTFLNASENNETKLLYKDIGIPYMQTSIELIGIYDSEGSFQSLDEQANNAILDNTFIYHDPNKETEQFDILDVRSSSTFNFSYEYRIGDSPDKRNETFSFHLLPASQDIPIEKKEIYGTNDYPLPSLYLSMESFQSTLNHLQEFSVSEKPRTNLKVYTDDKQGLIQKLDTLREEHPGWVKYVVDPVNERLVSNHEAEQLRTFMNMFSFFILTVAISNIANIVISGVLQKRKEYASLLSIGLEDKQLLKLLAFENATTIGKAFLIFVPIALLINFTLYLNYFNTLEVFHISWISIAFIFIVVFMVSLFAVLLAWRTIKKSSIIDDLRSDV